MTKQDKTRELENDYDVESKMAMREEGKNFVVREGRMFSESLKAADHYL
jgi:hypothetical protein